MGLLPRLVRYERPAGTSDPSDALLKALREIDPRAEIVEFAPGVWVLGCVEPSDVREARGRLMKAQLDQFSARAKRSKHFGQNLLLAELMLQGFSQIERYTVQGDPLTGEARDGNGFPCNLVDDFRERDANFRREAESTFQARLIETTGAARQERQHAILRDKLVTDGRSEYNRVRRGRVSVLTV